MRAVVQRVTRASVTVDNKIVGQIKAGMVILLGVGNEDNKDDILYLADKIMGLRFFDDEDGKLNLSVKDIGGQMLVVSQFTLFGDCRKGRRPSYSNAATPETANQLYEEFVKYLKDNNMKVETGIFQAEMQLELVNDGPVTLLVDSKKGF